MNKVNEDNNIELTDIGFSVIMPTYNQASFIRRAILSLKRQTYIRWELIIINDGCTDNTEDFIIDIISDTKVRYIKNKINQGLGYAINQGLNLAKYDYIAYLPSDDFYYENHLEHLKNKFAESKEIVLAFSGMKFDNKDSLNMIQRYQTNYIREEYCLQLVQTAHRKTNDRWLERNEFVTEDLYIMFWNKMIDKGRFIFTDTITCHWSNHPYQRHKIIGEKYGGCLNLYRVYYKVAEPLKIRLSRYKFVDERNIYSQFRHKNVKKKDGLKILIIGELSYNPERIYALEEYGHKLYGLWIKEPRFPFSNVGHLPFGNVEDISMENDWKKTIKIIKPDIIYALTNWDGVNLAHEVLKCNFNIPFVWHLKEGPFVCMRNGIWNKLFELYNYADGRIFLNEYIRNWYEQFLTSNKLSFILDLDPPKKEYFKNTFSPKLSALDGAIHTVIVGRMIGIDENTVKSLVDNKIHLHLYSENAHESRETNNNRLKRYAPGFFHVHPYVTNNDWTEEFSKYDAGWLHCFDSANGGDLLKATWDDLNIPARLYTLVAANIPSIQKDNTGHIVAMQDITKKMNIGIFYQSFEDLSTQLHDQNLLEHLNINLMKVRQKFTFDYYVPELTEFFNKVIKKKNES
jgi:glycosyltransferase involved in cell wall biosynthesis